MNQDHYLTCRLPAQVKRAANKKFVSIFNIMYMSNLYACFLNGFCLLNIFSDIFITYLVSPTHTLGSDSFLTSPKEMNIFFVLNR